MASAQRSARADPPRGSHERTRAHQKTIFYLRRAEGLFLTANDTESFHEIRELIADLEQKKHNLKERNDMTTQTEDSAVEVMAARITTTCDETFGTLIERRDTQIAAETAPLDSERESLLREHTEITESAHKLEMLLPARARQAQREADALTLAGKPEEAATKLAEMREAEAAPDAMKTRQQAISARIEAIGEEKKAIAKRVFADWYSALQSIIRAAEHALFIDLLDSGVDEMRAYQARHGLTVLVKDHHIRNLTADERSVKWDSGSRWYSGRR